MKMEPLQKWGILYAHDFVQAYHTVYPNNNARRVHIDVFQFGAD